MLPVVFIFIGFLFWRAPWRLRTISERIPQERAAVAGLITAMVLGFALNDSGIAVPGMMLGVVSASLIHLMLRVDDGLPRLPGGEHDSIPPDGDARGLRGRDGSGSGPGSAPDDAPDDLGSDVDAEVPADGPAPQPVGSQSDRT
jgi:hypothetical protein